MSLAPYIEDKEHFLPVRVYYEDTDAGGIVYYANYLKFAERARTELLRSFHIHQQKLLEEEHCAFVVSRVQIEYKTPAKLDDILLVRTIIKRVRGARLSLEQTVLRGDCSLVTLLVDIACIDKDGKPRRLLPSLMESFNKMRKENG